jgi:LysM repeat protein
VRKMESADRPGVSCPHLGSLSDSEHPRPGTSEQNACYLGKGARSISQLQQEAFCLNARHPGCPRVMRDQGEPGAGPEGKERLRREGFVPKVRHAPLPGVTSVSAVLVVLVVLVVVWLSLRSGGFSFGQLAGSAAPEVDPSPVADVAALATQVVPGTPTPTPGATVVVLTKEKAASPTPSPTPPPSVQPATPAPAPTAIAGTVYEVQDGDSVYSIAAKYGTTVEAIAATNNLADPSKLDLGQRLTIPAAVGGDPSTSTGADQ